MERSKRITARRLRARYYILKYKIVSPVRRVFEFSLKAPVYGRTQSLFRGARRVYKRRAELYYEGAARGLDDLRLVLDRP